MLSKRILTFKWPKFTRTNPYLKKTPLEINFIYSSAPVSMGNTFQDLRGYVKLRKIQNAIYNIVFV
jgi:hypothetical protein